MAKYICKTCNSILKKVTPDKKDVFISYKVLIVKTEIKYKCPEGCELKDIERIR